MVFQVPARSDLFSFGCVLYEMLTGKRAFEGENPASVIAAVLEREPAPLAICRSRSTAWSERCLGEGTRIEALPDRDRSKSGARMGNRADASHETRDTVFVGGGGCPCALRCDLGRPVMGALAQATRSPTELFVSLSIRRNEPEILAVLLSRQTGARFWPR